MKKVLFPLFFFVSIIYIGYEHLDEVELNLKLIRDPAQTVLNSNYPKNNVVFTFDNETYGKITLYAGYQPEFGFRHILARHTEKYFINFEDKNNVTMFSYDATGRDIIRAIDKFYENCVETGEYNRHSDRNIVYIGLTEINDKRTLCLLVVRKEDKSIVTFYPITEKQQIELDEPDKIPELSEPEVDTAIDENEENTEIDEPELPYYNYD